MEKLVRDLIPEIIESQGKTPICYRVEGEEHRRFLREKLKEEAQEFFEAESMEELADVLEVIEAIFEEYQFDKTEVEQIKKEKADKRGAFKDKIVLVRIESNNVCV